MITNKKLAKLIIDELEDVGAIHRHVLDDGRKDCEDAVRKILDNPEPPKKEVKPEQCGTFAFHVSAPKRAGGRQ